MPEFSIIVPVFNTEKYLRQCLDSVLAQTYPDYECIIVNDGSTDSSPQICEEYCANNPPFKLITQNNKGLSEARNTGIKQANGDYIVFLDSDDFISDMALQNLHDTITAGAKEVIISTTYAYYDTEEETKERCWHPENHIMKNSEALWFTFTADEFVVAACTLTVQRKFLIDHRLFFEPGLLHEDELWYPLIIAATPEVTINDKAFYYNRCNRKNSIANTPKIKKCFDKLFIVEKLSCAEVNAECKNAFRYRCGQLMTGIIKDYAVYSKIDCEKKLLNKINDHLGTLWKTGNSKYRFLYLACKVLETEKISKLCAK